MNKREREQPEASEGVCHGYLSETGRGPERKGGKEVPIVRAMGVERIAKLVGESWQ